MAGGGSAIRSGCANDESNGKVKGISKTLDSSHADSLKRKRVSNPSSAANKNNSTVNVPKKAPKLTTEQRFASRQSSLIEDLAKEKVAFSKAKRNEKGNFLSKFKIPRKVPEVQKPLQDAKKTSVDNAISMPEKSTSSKTEKIVPERSVKTINKLPLKGILKPAVRFAEQVSVLEIIPNVLAGKEARKTRNDQDTGLLKTNTSKSHQMPSNILPGANFPKVNAISQVVSWKTLWLKEQATIKSDPPVVEYNLLKTVSSSFSTFDEYCSTYYSLLMLEMWHSIYKDWRERDHENVPYVRLCIKDYCSVDDCWQFHCLAYLANAKSEYDTVLMEGQLITMRLMGHGYKEARHVFGYITEHKSEPIETAGEIPSLLQSLVDKKNGRIVTFIIRTRQRPFAVNLDVLVKAEKVSYIKPLMRQADAILTLSNSLLVRDILCPRKEFCAVQHQRGSRLLALGHFNLLQIEAILGATDAALLQYPIPQIKLFQGPPGTGKTNMIIGLIQQLVHPSITPKQKLLVVSSSNGAIDEIARRLMPLRPELKKKHPLWKMRLVRIGQPSQVSDDVKPIMIEELARNNLPTTKDSVKQEINRTQEKMTSLQTKINIGKANGIPPSDILDWQVKMASHCKHLRFLQTQWNREQGGSFPQHSKMFKRKVREVLENADVILSTLNSCRQNVLETTFGRKGSAFFTCCIVDEATQCTEPELLTALQYGISKLILVGDPKQLPATVLSTRATQLKYSMSFFERVFNFFRDNGGKSPVFMLTDQYRMHPEICSFPSDHFYSGRLQSMKIVDKTSTAFPLKPYVCINMPEGKENATNGTIRTNPNEANLVGKLCQTLISLLPEKTSIGIITPYQGQKKLFISLQSLKPSNKSTCSVEVNTIDGFQGREKDVIVLSCVRSGKNIGFLGNSQRLNVAITRARKCLIICGQLNLLHSHPHWRELIDNATRRNVVINMTSSDSINSVVNKLKV